MDDNFTPISNAFELREFLNGRGAKELRKTRITIAPGKLIDPAGSTLVRGVRIAEASVEGGGYVTEYVF